jgi:Ca-activated chloride channel family protein
VATVHVEQVFHNDTWATLEGTFFFPIPESASVSEFAIWDGNRRLVGEVRSREEARRIYDEIVRRQKDPGLLEYAGKNLFQASVFPIPPRADKKLELTYTQVLKADSGVVSYRYPLGTGRNINRIGRIAGAIDIENKEAIRNIYSPSHKVDISKQTRNRALISFEDRPAEAGPQDFQLFYGISNEEFGMSLLTYREPGKDGYFLLMVSPGDQASESAYSAKDVVFVIDTSGSMADEGKMDKAKAALQFGVKTLHASDRFNIVSFSGEEHLMASELIAADDAGRAKGEAFVRQLRPSGGTNINDALVASERVFDREGRPQFIVFITDGLPTVGTTDINRIQENARNARPARVRLFTFGVGYDVNTTLLDKLAADNGGMADYVEPREDLERKVSAFFEKINFPVLTDLQLDFGGVDADLIYPRNAQDLFRGTQLTLIGRYQNPVDLEQVRLQLSGRAASGPRTIFYDGLRFPLVDERSEFLPRLWATRRVGWLIDQIRSSGEQKELRDEIVELGTRFGIVTPYTSYLALEPERDSGFDDYTSRPIPLGGKARAPAARKDSRAMTATSGAEAVQQSKAARAMTEAIRVDNQATVKTMRQVGGKTFVLRDGVWVDTEYRADAGLPENVVRFASDEYFKLVQQTPKLSSYFSIGDQVIVVLEGRVYKVTPQK